MNILTIAAHPDDEVLGCGGTMARLAKEGHDVYIAILGEGITSRYDAREAADQDLLKNLRKASHSVAEILGAKHLFHYDLPDNRFDTVPLLDVVKVLENLMDQINPHIVFTQHGGDLNIDHNVVYRATLTATRPMAGTQLQAVCAYDVASSTEWAFDQFAPTFKANYFVDIEDTLELKIRAMETYESEARPFPHPRSPAALRAIAQRWGSVVGQKATESFDQVWRTLPQNMENEL